MILSRRAVSYPLPFLQAGRRLDVLYSEKGGVPVLFTSPYYVQLMDEVTIIHSLLSCGTIRVHHILLRLESGDHLHTLFEPGQAHALPCWRFFFVFFFGKSPLGVD